MKTLRYIACQRVTFTACGMLRVGIIDCAIGGNGFGGDPDADDRYDIQDDQGRMFCDVPEVQVHGLAIRELVEAARVNHTRFAVETSTEGQQ